MLLYCVYIVDNINSVLLPLLLLLLLVLLLLLHRTVAAAARKSALVDIRSANKYAIVIFHTVSTQHCAHDRLVGLVAKASASRVEAPGFESRSRRDFSGDKTYQRLKKLALQWLPCQAPDVVGLMLGLVVLVSVYCKWVWSAICISMWQHVKFSEQIH